MNIEQLIAQLTIDECLRLKPYKDSVGLTTIGIGRNLDGVGISKDEALYLLKNDIDRVCDQLDNLLPWWKQMTERRMQNFCNFVFNIGITKALTFKNTIELLRLGKYDQAADEILKSKWASQVGQRAQRISDAIRKG